MLEIYLNLRNLHTCCSFFVASLIQLDKILLTYIGNFPLFTIDQKNFKKAMVQLLLKSKFSNKYKKGFPRSVGSSQKILEGQSQKFLGWRRPFFPLNLFTSGLLCFKFDGEGGWCKHFEYFENHKSYVNEFLLC